MRFEQTIVILYADVSLHPTYDTAAYCILLVGSLVLRFSLAVKRVLLEPRSPLLPSSDGAFAVYVACVLDWSHEGPRTYGPRNHGFKIISIHYHWRATVNVVWLQG